MSRRRDRLPDRTAAITARRAGLALREPRDEAAWLIFEIAIDLALVSGPERADELLEDFAAGIHRLLQAKKRSLWRALREERRLRRAGVPLEAELEAWERAA